MTLIRHVGMVGMAVTTLVGGCTRPGAVKAAQKSLKADALVTMRGFEFVPKYLAMSIWG